MAPDWLIPTLSHVSKSILHNTGFPNKIPLPKTFKTGQIALNWKTVLNPCKFHKDRD